MAVRASIGGSGGDAFSVDLSGHGREPQRQEVPCRAIERPCPLEQCPDRAEDAAQSAEKRQGVSARLPLSGGAMVIFGGDNKFSKKTYALVTNFDGGISDRTATHRARHRRAEHRRPVRGAD